MSFFVTLQLQTVPKDALGQYADLNNFVIFPGFLVLTSITYLKASQALITLILVSMERYGCLVFKTLENLKIQQYQKLWPQ